MDPTDSAVLKRVAAQRALDFVETGMKIGLGTGTTAETFLELLAPRVRGGLSITGVATSERTAIKARNLGIPVAALEQQTGPLDITVDGADEADRSLHLIKGGGGALLREKIVASSSNRMIVIADESKLVSRLGRFPLPVEVAEFAHPVTAMRIAQKAAELGYSRMRILLRMAAGAPFKTDGGNVIYDCAFGRIKNAAKLGVALKSLTGVVEHGLFVGLATTLVIAHAPERVEIIERKTDG